MRGSVLRGDRCTMPMATTGRFCNRRSLPQAPVPICRRHAAEVYRFVQDLMLTGEVYAASVEPVAYRKISAAALIPRAINDMKLVYYLQLGDDVKIGMSSDLRRRLHHYPPSARLWAVEPGGRGVERVRHQQFRHTLTGGNEWFWASPELYVHVGRIIAQYGKPGELDPAAFLCNADCSGS